MFAIWRLWRRVGGWRAIVAQALLAWRLVRDQRVPLLPKLILPATLLYYFSPLNLLFEWIPFIGQVDDVGIAMLALGAFLKACPKHLVAEHASLLEEQMLREQRFERMGRVGRYARPTFKQWATDTAAQVRPAGGDADARDSEDRAKAA
ncbi:MAG TPA: YkvA family protein [Chloroflexota bacterium]|nr:YkvA family protein [Chloroflexota bacterium]